MALLESTELQKKYSEKFKGKQKYPLWVLYDQKNADEKSYVKSIERVSNKYQINVNFVGLSDLSYEIIENFFDIAEKNNGKILITFKAPNPFDNFDARSLALDIDGCSGMSLSLLYGSMKKDKIFNNSIPCTAESILEMVNEYFGKDDLEGLKIAVVGRSYTVGLPVSFLLQRENATTTLYNSKSIIKYDEFTDYDAVVSCAGVPEMIDSINIGSCPVVFDAGVNTIISDDGKKKFVGDFEYNKESFNPNISIIGQSFTPIKNGIGALTTKILLSRLF